MRRNAIISLGLAALLAIALRPGAVLALDHSSTRISALGWNHVSGVIPDLYTDLTVNPAYAFFADRRVVSYARRSIPGYAPSLPYLEMDSSGYGKSSMMVNELSAWGIGLSSWRTAVFAQWALYQPEYRSSDPQLDTRWNYASGLDESWSSYDDDFARLDLIAARALGDRYTLGLRMQGWGYYDSSSEMTARAYDRYRDPLFSRLNNQERNTSVRSFLGRRLSFDFQAGIVKSNDAGPRTDLALTVSLNRLDYRKERYDLQISKNYDSGSVLEDYNYYRYHWNDARKGDLWNFAMTFRHAFDGGIRVLAGGGVSTCSYETEWSNSQHQVEWGWSTRDDAISGTLDGEGSLLGGSCFFKGGRIFNLHRTTDLYLGLHGVFERIRTEEEPLVHYTSELEGEESAVRIDQPTRLESTETSFECYVPFSVEFRPSSCFTFFSSFILWGNWDKQTTTKPMPSLFYYYPPLAESRAGGPNRAGASSQVTIEPETYLTDWKRALSTGYSVTLGFSLHYRDRFFIDVYSGTEIIPSYLNDKMIDIRYVF
ncbi:MAG: hypothetical protein NTW97_09940 [Candidatus Krumholzibacteria bacterium]|nr:hypothetical protein [Candidatus Krumholzibacteria bacterium]